MSNGLSQNLVEGCGMSQTPFNLAADQDQQADPGILLSFSLTLRDTAFLKHFPSFQEILHGF